MDIKFGDRVRFEDDSFKGFGTVSIELDSHLVALILLKNVNYISTFYHHSTKRNIYFVSLSDIKEVVS